MEDEIFQLKGVTVSDKRGSDTSAAAIMRRVIANARTI